MQDEQEEGEDIDLATAIARSLEGEKDHAVDGKAGALDCVAKPVHQVSSPAWAGQAQQFQVSMPTKMAVRILVRALRRVHICNSKRASLVKSCG